MIDVIKSIIDCTYQLQNERKRKWVYTNMDELAKQW